MANLSESTFPKTWSAPLTPRPPTRYVHHRTYTTTSLPTHIQNVPENKRKAYLGNLLSTPTSPSLDGPLFHGFDAAGVGAGFHHFEDTTLAAKRLAERLVPGGTLFILDFVTHDAEPNMDATRGVHHAGFAQDSIRKLFEEAGAAEGYAYKELESKVVFEKAGHEGQAMNRRFFLARGTKTA